MPLAMPPNKESSREPSNKSGLGCLSSIFDSHPPSNDCLRRIVRRRYHCFRLCLSWSTGSLVEMAMGSAIESFDGAVAVVVPRTRLSWKCCRHVGNMSPTHNIVHRFWQHGLSLPTRCQHVAQGAVSRVCSSVSARQKYKTTNKHTKP